MCLWLHTLLRLTQQVVSCRASRRTFPATVLLMPANIKYVAIDFESSASLQQPCGMCPDLAPLTRPAQLEKLYLGSPLDQPIPQLPALQSLRVMTSDLQALSSATAALTCLILVAPDIDGVGTSVSPTPLLTSRACRPAHFTCLQTPYVDAQTVRNFKPEVLPPTLHEITTGYPEEHTTLDEPIFPVGSTIDRQRMCGS